MIGYNPPVLALQPRLSQSSEFSTFDQSSVSTQIPLGNLQEYSIPKFHPIFNNQYTSTSMSNMVSSTFNDYPLQLESIPHCLKRNSSTQNLASIGLHTKQQLPSDCQQPNYFFHRNYLEHQVDSSTVVPAETSFISSMSSMEHSPVLSKQPCHAIQQRSCSFRQISTQFSFVNQDIEKYLQQEQIKIQADTQLQQVPPQCNQDKKALEPPQQIRRASYKFISTLQNLHPVQPLPIKQLYLKQNQKRKVTPLKSKKLNKENPPILSHRIRKTKTQFSSSRHRLRSKFMSLNRLIFDHISEFPIACLANPDTLIQVSLQTTTHKFFLNLIDSKSMKLLARRQVSDCFRTHMLNIQRQECESIIVDRLSHSLFFMYELNGSFVEILSSSSLEVVYRIPAFQISRVIGFRNGTALAIASLNSTITMISLGNSNQRKPKTISSFKVTDLTNLSQLNKTILRCEIAIQNNTIYWAASFKDQFALVSFDWTNLSQKYSLFFSNYPNSKYRDNFVSHIQVHQNRIYVECRSHLWNNNNNIEHINYHFSVTIFENSPEKTIVDTHLETNLLRSSNPHSDVFFFSKRDNTICGLISSNYSKTQLNNENQQLYTKQLIIQVTQSKGQELIPWLIARRLVPGESQILTIVDTQKTLRKIELHPDCLSN